MSETFIERRCLRCEHRSAGGPRDVFCPHDGAVLVALDAVGRKGTAPLLGEVVDERYAVDGLLGVGGYGAVYRAWDPVFQVRVALKVLKAKLCTPLHRQRFLHEARILRRLRSAHVVRVSDFGTMEDGTQFMVMDWVPGRPLSDIFRQSPPPSAERMVGLLEQVLVALGDVHAEGLVHRDLKPANIMVEERAEGEWVTLIDFGIAKADLGLGEEEQPETKTGTALGTLRYMAPEQFGQQVEITQRTDIYAFGVMLYEVLAGRAPFSGSQLEIAAGHLRDAIPPLPGSTPPQLAALVMEALSKHPDDRPQDVTIVRKRLAAVAWPTESMLTSRVGMLAGGQHGETSSVGLGTTAQSMGEITVPRPVIQPAGRGLRIIGGVAFIGLLAAGIFLWLTGSPREPAREPTPQRIVLKAQPKADAGPPKGPVSKKVSSGATQRGITSSPADAGVRDAARNMPALTDARTSVERQASAQHKDEDTQDAAAEKGVRPKPAANDIARRPSAPGRPKLRRADPPPTPRAPSTDDAASIAAQIAAVAGALNECRCRSARSLLARIASPPDSLRRGVEHCRVPDFDEECVQGAVRKNADYQ